jgi:hypothetical protein
MNNAKELIIQTLKDKAVLKQDIFKLTLNKFDLLKSTLKSIADELREEMSKIDERIVIEYNEKSKFAVQFRVAGDMLVFEMHTNVFLFDSMHRLWQTSYLNEQHSRAYCGVINVFNFLNDSFKYNRANDLGYLVGRIFINHDEHFFVEGKRQMGFLYNDFQHDVLTEQRMSDLLQSVLLYVINFDLLTPPYEAVQEVSVAQLTENAQFVNSKTGKRLGFVFHKDEDNIS